jgi:pimeloyl-ACP methyl ester carboxylesterase
VRALVLINTLDPDVGVAGIFKRGSNLVDHPRLRPVMETWFRHMPHPERRHPPYWRSQFGTIREPQQQEYLEHARLCWADPETRLNWLALGFDPSNQGLPPGEKLAGLPPVCWIWGRDNKILPYEVGKRQLDVLKTDEVHVIDRRGYAVAWEAPDEINRIIDTFLNRHRRISLNGKEIDVAEPAFP